MIRRDLLILATLAVVVTSILYGMACSFVSRAVPAGEMMDRIREAESRGEADLAMRISVKAVFYSADPKSFIDHAGTVPMFQKYLRAVHLMRQGHTDAAEPFLMNVTHSDSPLLAARARGRLDEYRYRAGVPCSERIPY